MSNAIVQVGPSEEIAPGKRVIRALLGGRFSAEEIPLLEAWADGLHKSIETEAAGKSRSVCVLMDISGMDTYDDPKVIDILADLMKKDNPYIRKTATWGGNDILEMVEQVVRSMAGRDNIMNFKTEKEALKWLQE